MELMLALLIAGIAAAVAAPNVVRLYDTMRYRDAVRGLQQGLAAARYQAVTTGVATDLLVVTEPPRFAVLPAGTPPQDARWRDLDESLIIEVTFARQMNIQPGWGAFRFYPDGGSTGGSILIRRQTGIGSQLDVDWLLGRVYATAAQALPAP